MDLTINDVISLTLKYVQGQMDHLNMTEKKLRQDIKQKEDKMEHNEAGPFDCRYFNTSGKDEKL
jgi:hypothetical protein